MRDDGDGPEKITGEMELARVRSRALQVFGLGVGTAVLLTALLFTAR